MTTIVCISDTHNRENLPKIPKCDILLHSGDATMGGKEDEISKFANWFGSDEIDAKHRIFVPGNHDWLFETDEALARNIVSTVAEAPVTVLNQQSVVVDGLNIYGEPRQPWFYDWAFNVRREVMHAVWDLVPDNTDILVTHGPPFNYGDMTTRGEPVGCAAQAEMIKNHAKLKLVVCGHIHPGYGTYDFDGTIIANASVCDPRYIPKNRPITIIL